MTLALQLVTYGGASTIPWLLASLAAQTDRDWELWVYDAGSPAHEREVLQTIWRTAPVPARVEWGVNSGFAGGHNALFQQHDADLVLLLNPDAILAPDYIARLRAACNMDERLAAVSGLVLRWVAGADGTPERTTLVDSAGLRRRPWGAVEDAYAGKPVADLRPFSLFGVSGCVAMIRRAAAREVHPQGLLFTERLHTYKEDVDLAYRLRGTSWTNGVCHEAVAWHQRAVRPEGRFRRRIGRREAQSYLNHWRLAFWYWRASEWLNPLWIPYEGAKALWYLVRSPRVLVGALGQAWVFARERLAKRSIVG